MGNRSTSVRRAYPDGSFSRSPFFKEGRKIEERNERASPTINQQSLRLVHDGGRVDEKDIQGEVYRMGRYCSLLY